MERKVGCMECEKRFYVEDSSVPDGAEKGEAFRSKCPFCDGMQYVTLVEEE